MHTPQISVVLPVHNGANYLGASIRSVLSQDFSDFELHIIDDHSTDASAQIANSTGDQRVRYSRNDARFGLFKSLNRGIAKARGPLVRLWSHDDVMLPESLGSFARFAEAHPEARMIYCDFFGIDASGKRTGRERLYENQRTRTPEMAGSVESALLFFCFGCLPGNISTVLLSREAWQRVGGFREGFQQAPDYEMWVRISEMFQVGFIDKKLIELRDHPLQLAKVGQKQMTTIQEELPVFHDLQRRLHSMVSTAESIDFWRRNRGRQHLHWVVRALLRGHFKLARRGWHSIGQYGQPLPQAVFWALSLNGRFFTPGASETFDNWAARHDLSL